jgi:hypothetical protein
MLLEHDLEMCYAASVALSSTKKSDVHELRKDLSSDSQGFSG